MKPCRTLVVAVIVIAAIPVLAQNKPSQSHEISQKTEQSLNNPQATAEIPVIPGVKISEKGLSKAEARIVKEVRHELLMDPYYSIFDDLRYRVHGHDVELLGAVNNPVIKSDAEARVKSIEGVEKVTNNIEILPPSPVDQRIREEAYRKIFSFDGLSRYSWEAAPSIHIIVKNSRIKLMGVVDTQADKDAAGIQANSVPGVFSVQNDLVVAHQK
jgi:hyperosmotically inducible protein